MHVGVGMSAHVLTSATFTGACKGQKMASDTLVLELPGVAWMSASSSDPLDQKEVFLIVESSLEPHLAYILAFMAS